MLVDPFDPRIIWPEDSDTESESCICLCARRSLYARVSYEDLSWLSAWVWTAHRNQRGVLYPARQEGSSKPTRDGRRPRRIYLHRAIMLRVAGQPGPNYVVDHKNGDTLDARRSNLRWATLSENAKNTQLNRYANGVPE